ncbi:MAG: phosphotransferase [Firmicutes bacterium]|nr:phosphotransferase [Bacillota bacterium]
MKHILSDGWSILPTEITTIQNNVWKIETKEQSYALKRSELKEENQYFVCDAEKALTQNGFSRFAALIPTTAEHPYYATQDGLFTLHQWLDGERCDLTREDHLFAAAETLADFHNHGNARELQHYNSRRGDHFDHAEHLFHRIGELRAFYQIATSSPSSAFTQSYLRDYPKLITKARESHDRCFTPLTPLLSVGQKKREHSFITMWRREISSSKNIGPISLISIIAAATYLLPILRDYGNEVSNKARTTRAGSKRS